MGQFEYLVFEEKVIIKQEHEHMANRFLTRQENEAICEELKLQKCSIKKSKANIDDYMIRYKIVHKLVAEFDRKLSEQQRALDYKKKTKALLTGLIVGIIIGPSVIASIYIIFNLI